MRALALFGSLLLLPGGAGPLAAQGSTTWLPPGTAFGVTVDRFVIDDFGLLAATFHVSTLKPNHLTPEFGVAIFPQALAAMVVVTAIDVGGAINIPLPDATLLLRGGLSGLLAFGSGGAGAVPGFHYGASLLVKLQGKSGLRFDVIARRTALPPYEVSPAFLSFGIGITSLPSIH
jgi:hypothetical protein